MQYMIRGAGPCVRVAMWVAIESKYPTFQDSRKAALTAAAVIFPDPEYDELS